MLVDTQPATYQHVPATAEVRDQWVTSRLIAVLMDNLMPTLGSALMAMPLVFFLLWKEVDTYLLVGWLVALITITAFRYRMLSTYRLRYNRKSVV